MRDRAVIFLAAVLLVSCGRQDERPLLTISGSSVGEEAAVLARQLGRFERAHPGWRVRIRETPDDATQRHQLYVQWLNAHVGRPDVLQLDIIWTAEFAAAGWILPLDRFSPVTSDYFPATLDANRWRGSLYALPWFADVGMLYRRTDVAPDPPASLAELDARAAAALGNEGIRTGFVWQGARYEGLVTGFLEILGAFGGTIMTADGRIALDTPAALRALTFMRDQIRSGISPRQVLTWHEEESRFAFQNGTAVYMRNWPYAVAAMRDPKQSRVAGRFAVSPMPAAEGGRSTAALGGAELAVNAWSEHPHQAYALIAFLTAPAQMLERAQAVGQYPPRPSLYEGDALSRALGVEASQARAIIEAATARPVTPIWAELSEILQIELHRALTGETPPKEALRRATLRMQQLVDERGLGSGGENTP